MILTRTVGQQIGRSAEKPATINKRTMDYMYWVETTQGEFCCEELI